MSEENIEVSTLQCPKCKDIIYSRTRHDFRYCGCGSIFVDGGFDYLKYGCDNDIDIKNIKQETILLKGLTKQDLYNDWNKRIDKYGLIINETKED